MGLSNIYIIYGGIYASFTVFFFSGNFENNTLILDQNPDYITILKRIHDKEYSITTYIYIIIFENVIRQIFIPIYNFNYIYFPKFEENTHHENILRQLQNLILLLSWKTERNIVQQFWQYIQFSLFNIKLYINEFQQPFNLILNIIKQRKKTTTELWHSIFTM